MTDTANFDNKLILDPRFFDEEATRYTGLYEVADMYDNLKKNYYVESKSKAM